jgi:predicted transposase YbfD/YdcC
MITLCATIADCDDWHDVVQFAQQRETWFRRFLLLPNGIPAHDTFERVFAHLDPAAFSRCIVQWLRSLSELMGIKHIAIDGKTLRGSARDGRAPLHLVSAWATDAKLSLGQMAVEGKSNEIAAIPKLLEILDLKGALVTIDAAGCQKKIASQIVDQGGDYLLVVKANQERLLTDIQKTVEQALDGELPKSAVRNVHTTETKGTVTETRHLTVVYHVEGIRDEAKWKKLRAVGMCRIERLLNGESRTDVRYFIVSRQLAARRIAEALRDHWGIENDLHWQLDVSFHEDQSRVAERNGAENLSTVRKLGLALLRQHPEQTSVKRKRKLAALDCQFLGEVVASTAKKEKL